MFAHCISTDSAIMGFFKNYRVYILTTVAYSGSLLFGMFFVALSQCTFADWTR